MPELGLAEILVTYDVARPRGPGMFDTILFFGAMLAIMYFLIIRPQMQERRAHETLVASLAKDDRVVTASGIHGRVLEVKPETVVLEVAERTRITIDKTAVARKLEAPEAAK